MSWFLKGMDNIVTGLNCGGERVMCQAEHMSVGEHVWMWCVWQYKDGWGEVIHTRCHVVCDKAGMKDHQALCLSTPRKAGCINIHRSAAIVTYHGFKTLTSHIIFYWTCVEALRYRTACTYTAHWQEMCFIQLQGIQYRCGDGVALHPSHFFFMPYRSLHFSSCSLACSLV